MQTKILKRPGVLVCTVNIVMGFFFWIAIIGVFKWADRDVTVTYVFTLFCISMAVTHCFFSNYPYTNAGVTALSESMGVTLALVAMFQPLPLQEIMLMFFVCFAAVYSSGLKRIARLKKAGYTEEPVESSAEQKS